MMASSMRSRNHLSSRIGFNVGHRKRFFPCRARVASPSRGSNINGDFDAATVRTATMLSLGLFFMLSSKKM